MVRQREITESQWSELRACADRNMSLTAAARRMEVGHGWLRRAAKRQGTDGRLQAMFPDRYHQLNQFRLTPERTNMLIDLTRAGVPRKQIAERFDCCHVTLNRAIAQAGLKPKIDRIIASRLKNPRTAKPSTELLPRDYDPAVQWLTRAWRVAA